MCSHYNHWFIFISMGSNNQTWINKERKKKLYKKIRRNIKVQNRKLKTNKLKGIEISKEIQWKNAAKETAANNFKVKGIRLS